MSSGESRPIQLNSFGIYANETSKSLKTKFHVAEFFPALGGFKSILDQREIGDMDDFEKRSIPAKFLLGKIFQSQLNREETYVVDRLKFSALSFYFLYLSQNYEQIFL